MQDSERSLAIALGQLDDALTPQIAAQLADGAMRLTIALAAVARAGGQGLSPACEVLAQLHDLVTHQAPAA